MATTENNQAEVEFTQSKLTKNAVRFDEVGTPDTVKIGSLYVKKAAFPGGTFPDKVKVTLTW